jgi:hypothetical protein
MRRLVFMGLLTLFVSLGAIWVGAQPRTAAAERPQVYVVHLTGAEENPPVNTDARGVAVLRINSDETEISFNLHATNLVGDFVGAPGAHIHEGARGQNGGIRAHLTMSCVERNDSVHCIGTITDPTVVSTVIGLINQNRAYVNVHTTVNPSGQIRGQIE